MPLARTPWALRASGASKSPGSLSAEGRRNCTTGNTAFDEIRDVGPNVVTYFAVTDTTPLPRRTVVSSATRCVACHGEFSKDFHPRGDQKRDRTLCAVSHAVL